MPNVISIESNLCSDNVYIHLFDSDRSSDLSFVQAGFHHTNRGYSFGPMIRDHFLIHFISSGEGILELHNRRYSVKAGNCFLIYPHQISYYQSSTTNPLKYMWLGFCGHKAESLVENAGFAYESEIRPIVLEEEISAKFQEFINFLYEKDKPIVSADILYFTSMTYAILYLLTTSRCSYDINDYALKVQSNEKKPISRDSEYVRSIISIIQSSYCENILVEKIAKKLGLNRSYLNSVFKNHTGMTIKDYLTSYRISVSKKLLSDQNNTIQDVALKSGFSDPLYFSRIFKKHTGFSPMIYRKKASSEHITNII